MSQALSTTAACIGCHVVGFNQPGGYKDQASTANLTGVQCESCHGMGSTHDAFSSTPRRVTEQTCRICHTKDATGAHRGRCYYRKLDGADGLEFV